MTNSLLMVGDCRELVLSLEDQSVDCIVTSPPYYNLRDYQAGEGEMGSENSIGEFVQELVGLFAECRRVLKDSGTLWLNLGDSYAGSGGCGRKNDHHGAKTKPTTSILAPKNLMGIPWRVALALQDDGWILRNDIIWSKTTCFPQPVSDRCVSSHEHIFLFSKSRSYFFDWEHIATPAKTKKWPASSVGVNDSRFGLKSERKMKVNRMVRPRDVWTMNVVHTAEGHFATFPDELPKRCILAGCPEGGTVLDPFTGSGTTGKVALALGRGFVGFELNPEYADLARAKIREGACQFEKSIKQTGLTDFMEMVG